MNRLSGRAQRSVAIAMASQNQQSPHGRGSRFFEVRLGTVFPDVLFHFQSSKEPNQRPPKDQAQSERRQERAPARNEMY
jgi:hypothetical protein